MKIQVCGQIIEGTEYSIKMLLDEFCYYLKKNGIKKLGKEDMIAGFIVNDNVKKAIDEIIQNSQIKEK